MSKSNFTTIVQSDPDLGLYITFPDAILHEVGWEVGDENEWIDQGDGSYILRKKMKTELVMVDCVSTFRQRYVVEVPAGKTEWALDTVTLEEAKEFSQEHLGEQIFSHRVVSIDEVIEQCDKDNSYLKNWTREQKIKSLITPWYGDVPTLEDEVDHTDQYYDTERNR